MSLHRVTAGMAVLGLLTLSCLVLGDTPKKDDPAAQDREVITSKATRRTAASSVNFRKELNLPFPTLSTLGSRISAARRSADPVALAHAASELAVAEKVSRKKASLTSSTLLKESAELAKLRRQASELQAVENVAHQIQTQQDEILDLKKEIADAQAQAKADADFYRSSEEPTWTPRKLIVNNYTTQTLDVYVNGNFKMRVAPGGMQVGFIEHRWNPVTLTAYGDEDSQTWGPQNLWGRFNKYTWNIN
jgi:hypothetical protein